MTRPAGGPRRLPVAKRPEALHPDLQPRYAHGLVHRPTLRRPVRLAGLVVLAPLAGCLAHKGTRPPLPAPAGPPLTPPELRLAGLGERLPDLALPDLAGVPVALRSLVGRPHVLLWIDPACSFLRDAVARRDLAGRIEDWRSRGAGVLAVDSTGPAREGGGAEADREFLNRHLPGLRCLTDESGAAGRALGIEWTPAAVVVDAEGRIVYRGGLDNAPFGWPRGGAIVRRWVEEALDALASGQAVEAPEARTFGCRVRYAPDAPRPADSNSGKSESTPTVPGTGS